MRSLERGLALLESLSQAPAFQSELAERLGLPVSTAYRLLETLRRQGFVTRVEPSGLFQVGIRAFEVGSAFVTHSTLAELAHPVMLELVETHNESVSLAVLDGRDAVYLHQVEGQHVIRLFAHLGARVPLYCTGVGKALLAWQPPARIAELLGPGPLRAFTVNTLTDHSAVRADLARVRDRGWALDDQEREIGVRCVAAPIRDRGGQVIAALSMSAPADRLSDAVQEQASGAVMASATEIARRLGWPPGDSAPATR